MALKNIVAVGACLAAGALAQLGDTPVQATDPGFDSFPDCVNGPLANNSVCDTSLDPYTRAAALVSLFTLEEKFNNTNYMNPGVPRIGLPEYGWWQEGLHGVASSPGVTFSPNGSYSYATSFPQPILMGAAFDDSLIYSVADIVSTEARAFSNGAHAGLNFWTPNINPYRDPRWGRGQETPGEDPFHLSSYVNYLIMGLQGSEEYKKVVATCKHFAGYDLENWEGNYRYGFNAIISPQNLRDYFFPTFQQCARDSNVQSVMCSYNAVNGVPSCASSFLLETVLRGHWNFTAPEQWVTADCDAVQNIWNTSSLSDQGLGHHYTSTPEESAADALNAGTDLDCGSFWESFLPGAYEQGLFNISTFDRSLIRRYASLVRLGYFDSAASQPYRQYTFENNVSTPAAQALALKAAEEGIVLLKNDGTLPLKKDIKKVALIGPLANATMQMQGNYYGVAPYLHSPLYAAQQTGLEVIFAFGTNVSETSTVNYTAAVSAASEADAIIYVGGIDITIEAEGMDRTNITWPYNQLALLSSLAELSKPLIVIQMGTMVDSSSLVSNPAINSLIWAGYPGQSGGTALLNIIQGIFAPAGRLPVTQYPGEYVDQVPMTNMSLQPYTSTNISLNKNLSSSVDNPGRTYKWYTGQPVFEFGFGLHYTNFSVSFASSNTSSTKANTTHSIDALLASNSSAKYADLMSFNTYDVKVKNTGNVTSDYVVLLFLKQTSGDGPLPFPKKSLVGYTRLHDIAPGQTSIASLEVKLGNLARSDEKGNLVLWPGSYKLVFDVDAKDEVGFGLVGEKGVLDEWPEE